MHDLVLTDIISGTGCNEMPIDDVFSESTAKIDNGRSMSLHMRMRRDGMTCCWFVVRGLIPDRVCILDVRKPLDWVWPKDEMAVPFNECVGQKLEIEIGNIKPCGNIFPREREE
jgi:hypothetical protein